MEFSYYFLQEITRTRENREKILELFFLPRLHGLHIHILKNRYLCFKGLPRLKVLIQRSHKQILPLILAKGLISINFQIFFWFSILSLFTFMLRSFIFQESFTCILFSFRSSSPQSSPWRSLPKKLQGQRRTSSLPPPTLQSQYLTLSTMVPTTPVNTRGPTFQPPSQPSQQPTQHTHTLTQPTQLTPSGPSLPFKDWSSSEETWLFDLRHVSASWIRRWKFFYIIVQSIPQLFKSVRNKFYLNPYDMYISFHLSYSNISEM